MDWYGKRLADYPAGYRMNLVCGRCGNTVGLAFADLIGRLGPDATVGDVAARARCTYARHDPATGRLRPPCGGAAEAWPAPAPPDARPVAPNPVLPRWPDTP